jgi:phthiodiolone/phenolphthiodiolone dimycocerosates ketoreductase
MSHPKIDVGVYVAAKPPLGAIDALVAAAQDQRLDSVFVWDHLQDFVPSAIWDKDFAWFASPGNSPHEPFEFQTVLGYLAAKTPGLRLGVGVTEPIRRHPVLLAQAALTLAHLSQRPPILGIGAGERENTERYGLDFSRPVGRLEEALQIIRRCFDGQGPFDFEGEHFRLRGAVLDLPAPEGRTPEIWVAAHGPRMLRLTGRYGDGWYPFLAISPDDYATRLATIRAAALEAGRDPEAITPALQALVVVAPTEAEARAMLNAKAVRFFGLLLPAEVWKAFGLRHPLGDHFQGFVDLVPESYDRPTVEAAIAAVPREMVEAQMIWGTPTQVVAKLRAFGEAGLSYVTPALVSAAVSPEAAAYSVQAMGEIAHALMSGESMSLEWPGKQAA